VAATSLDSAAIKSAYRPPGRSLRRQPSLPDNGLLLEIAYGCLNVLKCQRVGHDVEINLRAS